jgi:hypothetical protein
MTTPDSPSLGVAALDRALAQSTDGGFIGALGSAVTPRGTMMTPLAELPEPIRMLRVLDGLALCISDGIWKFLIEGGSGTEFPLAIEWTAAIGATRVQEYLLAAAKVFPRGRIPVDDGKRGNLILKMGDRSPDPLREVDRRFPDAFAELLRCLRAHVAKHRGEIGAAIDALAGNVAQSAPRGPTAQELVARLREMARAVEDGRKPIPEGPAVYQGDQVDAFLASAEKLTPKQWREVLVAYSADSANLSSAMTRAVRVCTEVVDGRGARSDAFKPMRERRREAFDRVRALAANVSSRLQRGQPRYAESDVLQCILGATRALDFRPRLERTPKGRQAATTLLAPFAKFVTFAEAGAGDGTPAVKRQPKAQ